MAPVAELPTCWPSSLGQGYMVLCCKVECTVDALFQTTWISSELSEEHHKARSDVNFRQSPWVTSKEALETCGWTVPGEQKKSQSAVSTHRFRKVHFQSAPSALATKPFENTEIIQCCVYSPGKRYVLEAATSTTAPYGDKFKVYLRYVLSADPGGWSTLLITYDAVWDASMNFMLKPMVSKGMDVGLRSAFKTYRQLLQNFHPVTDISEQELAASQAAAARAAAVVEGEGEPVAVPAGEEGAGAWYPAEAGVHVQHPPQQLVHAEVHPVRAGEHAVQPRGPRSLLDFMSDQLVYRDQVPLLSDFIATGMRSINDQGLVARVLAVLLTLTLVSVTLTVIKTVEGLCVAGGSFTWLLCLPLTHVLDIPDSTYQVLSALALVALVNWAIMKGSEASVAYLNQVASATPVAAPSSASIQQAPLHAAPAGTHAQPSSSAAAGAAGAAAAAVAAGAAAGVAAASAAAGAPAAVAGSKGTSGPTPAAGKGAPAAGASMPPKHPPPRSPDGSAAGPTPSVPLLKQPPVRAAATAAAGVASAAAVAGSRPTAVSQQGGAKGPAAVATGSGASQRASNDGTPMSPPAPFSPPQEMEMQCLSPPSQARADALATAAAAAAVAAASESSGIKKLLRIKSQGTAGDAAAAMAGGSGGSAARGSGPPGAAAAGSKVMHHASMEGQDEGEGPLDSDNRSWMDSVADTFKGAWLKSQEPFTSFMGTSAEAAEYGLLSATSPTDDGSLSAIHKSKSTVTVAAGGHGAGAGLSRTSLSDNPTFLSGASAPLLGAKHGGSPSQLTDVMDSSSLAEEEPDVVEEEVFENERFQPFRLWGHTWPGHFLPSDRVGHWSDRKDQPYGNAAMVFEQVAPKLPNDGWRWVDDEWSVDMEGADVEAVDAEGWFYALDFNYLKRHPGSGKCSTHHFVRRRRWVRVRARTFMPMGESLPMPIPQTASKDDDEVDTQRNTPPAPRVHSLPEGSVRGMAAGVSEPSFGQGVGGAYGGNGNSVGGGGGGGRSLPASPAGSGHFDNVLQAPQSGVMDRGNSWGPWAAGDVWSSGDLKGSRPPRAGKERPASSPGNAPLSGQPVAAGDVVHAPAAAPPVAPDAAEKPPGWAVAAAAVAAMAATTAAASSDKSATLAAAGAAASAVTAAASAATLPIRPPTDGQLAADSPASDLRPATATAFGSSGDVASLDAVRAPSPLAPPPVPKPAAPAAATAAPAAVSPPSAGATPPGSNSRSQTNGAAAAAEPAAAAPAAGAVAPAVAATRVVPPAAVPEAGTKAAPPAATASTAKPAAAETQKLAQLAGQSLAEQAQPDGPGRFTFSSKSTAAASGHSGGGGSEDLAPPSCNPDSMIASTLASWFADAPAAQAPGRGGVAAAKGTRAEEAAGVPHPLGP